MSNPETLNERPPVSLWRRILLGLSAVVVGLLGAGFVLQLRDGSAGALQRLLADLDESDPNWRLEDLERTRDQVPQSENSARVAVRAISLLPKDWGKRASSLDEKLRSRESLPPSVRLDANQQALLEKTLAQADAAVIEARKLAGMPRGRYRLTFENNPMATRLPDQQKAREAASLLQLDALRLAQQKDARAALASCRAMLNAARSLGDEPFLISQYARIGCVELACGAIERTLGLGEAADADLADLQHSLAEEDRHNTILVGLRGERAGVNDLYTKLAQGRIPFRDMVHLVEHQVPGGLPWQTLLLGFSKADVRSNHLLTLELLNQRIEAARLPLHEQIGEDLKLATAAATLPPRAALARALVPAWSKVGEAGRRKHARVRSLLVLLAAERYRLKHGTWPEEPELPLDPYDGKPIRYRKLADGVVAYAIGKDGKDDGGKVGRYLTGTPALDEGYRLWDVTKRRQEKP